VPQTRDPLCRPVRRPARRLKSAPVILRFPKGAAVPTPVDPGDSIDHRVRQIQAEQLHAGIDVGDVDQDPRLERDAVVGLANDMEAHAGRSFAFGEFSLDFGLEGRELVPGIRSPVADLT